MKAAIAGLACLALALAAAASAGVTAQNGVRVSLIGGTEFPDRAYAVSVPPKLGASPRIRVRENGDRVSALSVLPANLAGRGHLAAVLAIDTSESMRGAPIKAALAAARAFAARRNIEQQLAVLTFNSRVSVLLPFTTSTARIDEALAKTPRLAEGTHVYDAVGRAAALVRRAGVDSASIVLLSDGDDVGSVTTSAEASDAARQAGTRVFAVGLRSQAFDPTALTGIADATDGRYAEATSTAALPRIFDALGFELSHEYLVRYRSLARADRNVKVEISVAGVPGVVRTSYRTPPLGGPVASPYQPSAWWRFWRSGVAFALVMALTLGLLAAGALAVLRRQSDPRVRRRVGQFVSLASSQSAAAGSGIGDVLADTDSRLERHAWWGRFKQALEIAGIGTSAMQIVVGTAVATLVVAWLLLVIVGPAAPLLAIGVPLGVFSYIRRRLDSTRNSFLEQLPDNLAVLAGALRAGHSLVGALSVVVEDAGEPTRTEFRRVIAKEQTGVPLEDAFDEVAERMDCRDLEQVAVVAALGRDTGGNTAEVLDRVTETIRERADLRRLVRTLTAQGRMSRWVVSLLPLFLLLVITAINPDYMQPLYDEGAGRLLLVAAVLMVVAGSLVIRRIVNIKV